MSAPSASILPSGRPRQGQYAFWWPSERIVFGALGFLVILGTWEAVSRLGLVKRVLLSSPTLIVSAGMEEISSGAIWPHLAASSIEFAIGFAAALAVGIPLGLILGWFRRLSYVFDPWLSAFYATPTVALIPLIVVMTGTGLASKVTVVFLEAVIVVAVSAITGVRAVDARYHDIARSFGASKWIRFRTVVLPASVPFILTGVRIGVGRAFVGVIVSEFIASNVGIGFYISLNATLFRSAHVFFAIILLGAAGVILAEIVLRLERRFDRWRPVIR